MKYRLILPAFLIFTFLIISFSGSVMATDTVWTEKKLGKVILKADKAAQHKKWSYAIKFGEQMLDGSKILDKQSDARYVNLLKTLNVYYDKAGRLKEVGPRVVTAYMLSKKHLGPTHETTFMSRTLYYKLQIFKMDYAGAIPLVLENIALLKENEKNSVRLIHYLKQLYSLYGLTGELEREEKALIEFLAINSRFFGDDDEDNKVAILILAQNYCRQKESDKFNQLTTSHGLKYSCG